MMQLVEPANHREFSLEHASEAVEEFRGRPGALINALHKLQETFGYIDDAALPMLAKLFNLSRAEVHGVTSFYHDFRRHKPGRYTIKVCQAEACQAMGSEALTSSITQHLGCNFNENTQDGMFTLEKVYCLGNCACSPNIMVDKQTYGRVTEKSFKALTSALAAKASGLNQVERVAVNPGQEKCRQDAARLSGLKQVERVAFNPGQEKCRQDAARLSAFSLNPVYDGGRSPPNPPRIYVPRETTASSLGVELVVEAILAEAARRQLEVHVVRNGSRGACFLEPLVEVDTPNGRVGYGPVSVDDVPALFDADFLQGGNHALALGNVSELPWFKNQERLTFARCGLIEATSVDAYEALGGFVGLRNALRMSAEQIVQEVMTSGLRGRGGAAFPTGIKWRTVLQTAADQKYIVCNADEGDSGTFSDRLIMEGDPLSVIEGMVIAGIAVGADKGFVYLRSEYPLTHTILLEALENARNAGYLGTNILQSGKSFDIEIRIGAGAYICGEETSLLESLEGKRGEVRPKPPLPAHKGLFGKPTIVNNVISLATIPVILEKGGQHYANFGRGRSLGTLPFQLAGNIKYGGLVEKAFGLTLRQLIEDFGGGTATGKPVRAVQVGGPLGAYFPASLLDTPLDYEDFAKAGGMVGHGGVVVFDTSVNMAKMARFAMEFCAVESCGKCTPCRIGSVRGVETIDRIVQAKTEQEREKQHVILKDLCETMESASLCAMGGLTPLPVMSAIQHFKGDFQ